MTTDDEGVIEVISAPADYAVVRKAFDAAGLKAEMDGIVMKALNETELAGEDAIKMQKPPTPWKAWTTCRKSIRPSFSTKRSKPQATFRTTQ